MTKSEVVRILTNPIYYGEFRWGGKVYKGAHTPIITKDLFDAVQAVMTDKHRPRAHHHQFTFRGLLTCSRCGCSITAEAHKGHVYYRCSFARGKCGQPYVREEVVDQQMANLVKEVEIDQKRLDGKVTEDFWREKHDAWRKEQEDVRATLQRHERANVNYYEEGVGILELAQQAYSLYVGASQQNKRDIVRSLLSNCTLSDTTLCPTYRKPYQLLREALQMKKRGSLADVIRTYFEASALAGQ